jgi:16S rRNA processing protein RimM
VTAPDDKPIALAAIAGAHGVKGEVRLKLFGDGIDSLKRHRQVDVDGRQFALAELRLVSGGAIARLSGIADRGAAEALRGRLVTIPRSALPPLTAGEYYHADLIGLPCRGRNGEALGTVVAVDNFGAGDLVEVERPDGKRALVPFRDGIADLEEGAIVVDPDFLA